MNGTVKASLILLGQRIELVVSTSEADVEPYEDGDNRETK